MTITGILFNFYLISLLFKTTDNNLEEQLQIKNCTSMSFKLFNSKYSFYEKTIFLISRSLLIFSQVLQVRFIFNLYLIFCRRAHLFSCHLSQLHK